MKLGLINSAWVQANQPTVFGLRKTKEIGFDSIDLFIDPLEADVKERKLVKDECDRLDLPIVSVCCVALGLIDFQNSVQRFHVERVKRYLDLVYQFEAKNLLLVLGEYLWNQEVISPEEQWQAAVANCRVLGDYAADLGIEIALELEPFRLSLLNSVDAMVRFLDDCNHPAVRATSISRICCWLECSRRSCRSSAAGRSTCTSPIATARNTAICLPVVVSCRSSRTWSASNN